MASKGHKHGSPRKRVSNRSGLAGIQEIHSRVVESDPADAGSGTSRTAVTAWTTHLSGERVADATESHQGDLGDYRRDSRGACLTCGSDKRPYTQSTKALIYATITILVAMLVVGTVSYLAVLHETRRLEPISDKLDAIIRKIGA